MIAVLLEFLWGALACVSFCFLFHTPKKSIVISAVMGGLCFIIAREIGGYAGDFVATLMVVIVSEIAARRMKMTALAFITVALIPLVPGVGMYRTMRLLALGELSDALRMGAETMLTAGSIAAAIALGSMLMRLTSRIVPLKG